MDYGFRQTKTFGTFKIIAVIFHQIGLKDLQFYTYIYNEKMLVHPKSSQIKDPFFALYLLRDTVC